MATRKKIQVVEEAPMELDEETAERIRKNEERLKEMVEIELFYDGDKYKDDVVVCINGYNYIIQRGKRVEVPRFVAEALQTSADQDKQAALLSASLASQFENDSKKNGIDL